MITTTNREVPIGKLLLDWARAESDRIAQSIPQLGAYSARAAAGLTEQADDSRFNHKASVISHDMSEMLPP